MILAQDLTKRFGQRCAVDAIQLDIPRGETFGLLGPNGAGKTTTIHMLVGILRPDGGRITIAGSDPFSPEARRSIGVAPQSLSLYDELTAAENLRFFGQLYGLTGRNLVDRLQWTLELAELSDRAKDRVRTFSGGMKRRLNLAVALMHAPQVLFLDEPTVGVDPQSRNHILQTIERLATHGMTVVYTTHYMEEAQRICKRVAVMDHGKILALNTVPNLIAAHGGRSVVHARLPNGDSPRDFPGAFVDGEWRFECTSPIEELARWHSQGIHFEEIRITQPDLESVFLTLTGRSLRD